MSGFAVCSRRLQFEAGPQRHTFFACERHRGDLELGNVTCFFAIQSEPVRDVDAEDEQECDLCREG